MRVWPLVLADAPAAEARSTFVLAIAERIGLVLGGGLGAVLAVERHHLRELRRRALFLQWRTWLIVAPIYAAAVTLSRFATLAFALAVSTQAAREFAALGGLPRAYRRATIAVAAIGVAISSLAPRARPDLMPVLILCITVLPLMARDTGEGVRHFATAALGVTWISAGLTSLVAIRSGPGGPRLLLAIGLAIALSDVIAFGAGTAFGRRRFAGAVSPNKTIEGLAGNLAGAIIGWWLMGFALPAGLPLSARLTLPAVIAIGAVWGDLIESLVKRHAGTKEAGTCLPGFGGLLDRIDSMLLVLPLCRLVLVVAR